MSLRHMFLRVAERARTPKELKRFLEIDADVSFDESLFCKRIGSLLDAGFGWTILQGALLPQDADPEYQSVIRQWVELAAWRHHGTKFEPAASSPGSPSGSRTIHQAIRQPIGQHLLPPGHRAAEE